jgi:hypothetical protein
VFDVTDSRCKHEDYETFCVLCELLAKEKGDSRNIIIERYRLSLFPIH